MARKKANGTQSTAAAAADGSTSTSAPSTPDRGVGEINLGAGVGADEERDAIRVNNANLADLKNACDDAVKRILSHPDLFTQNHTHTDVKLALGWASVAVAGATALYGWRVEFEAAKPLVWAGVVLYVVLTAAATLYAFFVEKDTVYVGRRKSLAKRIETEHITVASRTVPAARSAPSPSTARAQSRSKSGPTPSSEAGADPDPARAQGPRYAVRIAYERSSNSGKSLLGRGAAEAEAGYAAFFDAEGGMDQRAFERWFGTLVERVMEK